MLIAVCDRELESLRVALVLEKEQSGSLKNLIEQLKAEATAVMLEKSKEHLEVANKLKSLEERKEMLEDQLEGLKTRTTDLSSVVIQERNELVDELTGLTNAIEEVIYGGENLMSNLSRILEKVNAEEPHNDTCSSEKTNARTSAPLIKNKSGHVVDRRSPLKEHNY
jgi:chromosome segregation ATPase